MRPLHPRLCAPFLVLLVVNASALALRPAHAGPAGPDSLTAAVSAPAPVATAGNPTAVAFPAERVRAWQTGLLRSDRMQHGSLSMTLALAGGVLARKAGTGWALSFGFGLAKEIYDIRGTGFDAIDLVADAVGAGIGAGAAAAVLH